MSHAAIARALLHRYNFASPFTQAVLLPDAGISTLAARYRAMPAPAKPGFATTLADDAIRALADHYGAR